MNKKSNLISNTILFAINSFGSRIMVFLLVPLYAHYMTSDSYSVADLVYSTSTLVLTVFSLKVGAAILRFAKPESNNNQSIISNSILVIIVSFIAVVILTILLVPILQLNTYYYYLPVLYLFAGIKDIAAQFCKSTGKSKIYAFEGIISSLTLLILSYVFLAFIHLDIKGYLTAILVSQLIAIIYLVVAGHLKNYILKPKIDRPLLREMLQYSLPLVPNSFSWWIIQISDRYMVSWMISDHANGLYTMAYKIPSMLGVLSDIFMQAWVLTAIDEYDGERNFKEFTSIYESFETVLFIISSIILCLNKPIANLLYGIEFSGSSGYVPLLIFALLFNNIQAFFGSIYNAAKKTKELMYSSFGAAVFNIILNVVLISTIGVYGAIISTCLSYIALSVFRIYGAQKYTPFRLNYYMLIVNVVLLLVQSLCETFVLNDVIRVLINCSILIAVTAINFNRVKRFVATLKHYMSLIINRATKQAQ